MKKLLIGLFVLTCYISLSEARGREGYLIKGTYEDTGDTIEMYAVNVGTTTPVQIFYSTWTQSVNFREIMFQNTSTNSYRVYVGTLSTVSASMSTNTIMGRFFIPGGGSWTANVKTNLWAIFEQSAHNTGLTQVLGVFERDSKDADITNR